MLLAERQESTENQFAKNAIPIRMRVCCLGEKDHLVAICPGKTTVGSSPRCNLRIPQLGVQPLHLVIIADALRVTARRWAAGVRLNGEPFDEAVLQSGDQLTVGSATIHFEDAGATASGQGSRGAEPSRVDIEAALWSRLSHVEREDPAPETPSEFGKTLPEHGALDYSRFSAARSPFAKTPPDEPASSSGDNMLAALQQSREEYCHLAERVDDLECLLQAAFVACGEQQKPASLNDDYSSASSSPVATNSGLQPQSGVADPDKPPRPDEDCVAGTEERESVTKELRQLTAVNDQLAREKEALAHERLSLQQKFDAVCRELEACQQERQEWDRKQAELQQRLAESELKSAEQAQRIKALEQEVRSVPVGDWNGAEAELYQNVTNHSADVPLVDESTNPNWDASVDTSDDPAKPSSWPFVESKWESGQTSSSFTDEPMTAEFDWPSICTKPRPNLNEPPPSGPAESYSSCDDSQRDSPISLGNSSSAESIQRTVFPSEKPNGPAVGGPAGADVGGAPSRLADQDDLAPFAHFSIWNQGAASDDRVSANRTLDDTDVQHSPGDHPMESVAKGPTLRHASHDSFQAPTSAHLTGTTVEPATNVGPGQGESSGSLIDVPTAMPGQAKTASFIERYAHMFADDSASEEPVPSTTTRQTADDIELRKPRSMGVASSAAQSQPAEEEESIEQYMAKLLQRVRGKSSRTPVLHGAEASKQPPTEQMSSTSPTVAPRELPENQQSQAAPPQSVRPKVTLAEQSANLEAFRALANESARRAISRHAFGVHRRSAVTKAIVATLAGMTSVLLMLEAPDWRDLQFIAACVSLLAAAYWAGQTYGTMIESFRAAAYDGPEPTADDLADLIHARLPVDAD
jgi:hypothetical protein